VVYVGADNGFLYEINAVTGQILLGTLTGGAIDSSPDFAYGIVYVGSDDGRVYAISASRGAGTGDTVLLGIGLAGMGFARRRSCIETSR
jgi:outer membrane protein assembly factor BamB